jgi:hypothetical protein
MLTGLRCSFFILGRDLKGWELGLDFGSGCGRYLLMFSDGNNLNVESRCPHLDFTVLARSLFWLPVLGPMTITATVRRRQLILIFLDSDLPVYLQFRLS